MMYGGYYQNLPGNMTYGNFGFQGMPGSLLNSGMMGYQNPNMTGFDGNSNYMMEINTRLNNLENRVRRLEQKIVYDDFSKDDNSMYMI